MAADGFRGSHFSGDVAFAVSSGPRSVFRHHDSDAAGNREDRGDAPLQLTAMTTAPDPRRGPRSCWSSRSSGPLWVDAIVGGFRAGDPGADSRIRADHGARHAGLGDAELPGPPARIAVGALAHHQCPCRHPSNASVLIGIGPLCSDRMAEHACPGRFAFAFNLLGAVSIWFILARWFI